MKEFMLVAYMVFTPIATLIYVMFNGYPDLLEATLLTITSLTIFYLLTKKTLI